MKKILSGTALILLVWGCAKKIAPSNGGTTGSNAPAMSGDSNAGNVTESQAGTNMAQAPAANTGTFGTKEAAKESAADAAAIAGQSIYNAKCGRCHGLKVTTDFTAERWASIIAVMAPRANLTDAERENVYAYVKANSKK
jgi:mono/diheme cytochrome c family protein